MHPFSAAYSCLGHRDSSLSRDAQSSLYPSSGEDTEAKPTEKCVICSRSWTCLLLVGRHLNLLLSNDQACIWDLILFFIDRPINEQFCLFLCAVKGARDYPANTSVNTQSTGPPWILLQVVN